MIHNRETVAQALGFFHEMRGEQQGFAAQHQLAQALPDQVPCLWIKAGGGFIQKQQIGIVDQRTRQCQPPLHAARQRLNAGIGARGQSCVVE